MAFIVDKNGNITLIQGDSGSFVIEGLPTDKNYTIYFAIRDSKHNLIGSELSVSTNNNSSVVFELISDLTDLLKIKSGEKFAIYYFGVKLCSQDGLEDTLMLGESSIGEVNTITVYPKKVEGYVNG